MDLLDLLPGALPAHQHHCAITHAFGTCSCTRRLISAAISMTSIVVKCHFYAPQALNFTALEASAWQPSQPRAYKGRRFIYTIKLSL